MFPLDPQDDYFKEIVDFLLSSSSPPTKPYDHRPVYMNFLSKTSSFLNLSYETFTESISLFDQLAYHSYDHALVCLWISAKVVENYGQVPLLSTFINQARPHIQNDRSGMLKLERQILNQTQFRTGKSIEEFIGVYGAFGSQDKKVLNLARCLAEIFVMNGERDAKICAQRAVYQARNVVSGRRVDLYGITDWIREKVPLKPDFR